VFLTSDAPEIDIDEELVTSGKDYETELKCVVHAEPKAKVQWLKDNAPITDFNHAKTSKDGNKYFYHIQKTEVSDFGKYKCIATNSKGTTNSKEIELTGMFLKFFRKLTNLISLTLFYFLLCLDFRNILPVLFLSICSLFY
jgi:hypothetical protein